MNVGRDCGKPDFKCAGRFGRSCGNSHIIVAALFSFVCAELSFAAVSPEPSTGKVREAVETASENTQEILEGFRDSIRSNWRKISGKCAELIGLHDDMSDLPEKAWFHKDRRDQKERIQKQLAQIRSLLLSTDARKILASVESFDAKIADVDANIREAKEKRFLHPGQEEKFDAKVAKYDAKRHALEERRAEAARSVLAELNAIGLRLSGGAAEKCIFTVNVGDLINAAVVAKHVVFVVEALGEQMKAQGGDVVAARRYYGVYVAMLEVQKSCFDEYLEKSRNGPWRWRLAAIRKEATEQREAALRSAGDAAFDLSQRAVFRKNAKVFEMTQRAVDAYVKILDRHEAVVARKAEDAARMLTVARSSLASVTLAGDFLSLVQTAEDTFDALLQLELPPLELFSDDVLQAEFSSLTDRLK